ncbi:MAG: hypothetical protein Ct9H300mP11_26660 [Chloroflexota bacterium]|nr:MAG: hypothetical protein Ct9H300mP11_26660 [Chloroflexota bacterium]
MFNSLKGMVVTLVSTVKGLQAPVTRQYPEVGDMLMRKTNEPTPVKDGFMGFPALTWDDEVGEPSALVVWFASGDARPSVCPRL